MSDKDFDIMYGMAVGPRESPWLQSDWPLLHMVVRGTRCGDLPSPSCTFMSWCLTTQQTMLAHVRFKKTLFQEHFLCLLSVKSKK